MRKAADSTGRQEHGGCRRRERDSGAWAEGERGRLYNADSRPAKAIEAERWARVRSGGRARRGGPLASMTK